MRRALSVSLVLFLNVIACGSDSNNNTDVAGVPRSTALKDVSNSDLIELCKANQSKLESLGSCLTTGLEEPTEAACKTAVSECEQSNASASSDIDCAGANNSDLKDCSVTVGEFSDCLQEVKSYIDSLTCKEAGKPFAPPSCFGSLMSKCKSLFN